MDTAGPAPPVRSPKWRAPRGRLPQAAEAPRKTRAFSGKLCSAACGHDRASPGASPPCSQRPALTAPPEGNGPVRPPCAKQGEPERGFALFPSVQVTLPGFKLVQTCAEHGYGIPVGVVSAGDAVESLTKLWFPVCV